MSSLGRSISAVKVDHTPPNGSMPPRITIEWTDSAGERLTIERHHHAAEIMIADLLAQTLLGEQARTGYLIGFIRCHSLRRAPD